MHEDRLFPADPAARAIARRLYAEVAGLPIVSPHGHTDPAWFAYDRPFADPADLLVLPDHSLLRMLYSHGVPLDTLGLPRLAGGEGGGSIERSEERRVGQERVSTCRYRW